MAWDHGWGGCLHVFGDAMGNLDVCRKELIVPITADVFYCRHLDCPQQVYRPLEWGFPLGVLGVGTTLLM